MISMTQWIRALLGLFVLLATTANAGLIVHKKFKQETLVKSGNISVIIQLWNKGPSRAVNITLHDQTFNNASAFKLVAGKNYQKIPDLKSNQSHSISFVVRPKVSGWIATYPAVVKYASEDDGKKLTSYSSFKPMHVLPYKPSTSIMVFPLILLHT
jgi:hypothetical protein